ncbi:UvrD-helicase domain-containing protein [Corynebacterium sp. H128]|uniref:UvrD-helicase domain-containing protein n=1 Tax=Corynebacterium sp. H128 TaxID=3133427 RepID=UPI0030A47FB8
MFNSRISPADLAIAQQQKFPPTPQQEEVIGAAPGPMLVVAGAGAGKTETMANRVVWLVANGFVEPERVLGLTFTRKAAQELRKRIRDRLTSFAMSPQARDVDPTLQLLKLLENINPTVSTYDSYAGRIVGEYGLLLPVEPSARLITNTELFSIAREVVSNYRGELSETNQLRNVTKNLLDLTAEIDNHMVTLTDIVEESNAFLSAFDDAVDAKGKPAKRTAARSKFLDPQSRRLQFLPLVQILKQELAARNVITFGEQMSLAARVASLHPEVGQRERAKFGVVMLDEYQDTSHAQRVLLRSLFGGHDPSLTVNAVGDPMQSIYGWRGATAANLARFVDDFPQVTPEGAVSGEAPKAELTLSFRNPSKVLTAANVVADAAFKAHGSKRPVQPLAALAARGEGQVKLAWFANARQEVDWVANNLAEAFHGPRTDEFTGAVLVRKKKHIAPMVAALREREVPVEVVGLSGLLTVPEVQDLICIAKMLINPQDNEAALRILAGPAMQLGSNDLIALHKRARNLGGRTKDNAGEEPHDPLAKLKWIVANAESPDPAVSVGLTDAIADLGESEKYSDSGYQRLRELAAALRHLRTHSISRGLSDLFSDIETVMGVRTEVLARQDPQADGAIGTVHLDAFAAEVAAFESTPGATLRGLLDYFDLAVAEEDGLEPGEVSVRSERVQLLTVHKSKGLEWQHVAVVHADNRTYVDETAKGYSVKTWLGDITKIPSTLRGDARAADDLSGAPVLDIAGIEEIKELDQAIAEHKAEFRRNEEAEATRLFYVAITRSQQNLYVSASYNWASKEYNQNAPYQHLLNIKEALPESVDYWEEDFSESQEAVAPESGIFPVDALGGRRQAVADGAARVRAAIETGLPDRSADSELSKQWETDVTALIQEQDRLSATHIEVPVLAELTATDMVALSANPEFFARRSIRPVPFKPNSFAKRGTAFHEWLEQRFGATSLLDEEQLPGMGEELVSDAAVIKLKEAFLASEWADRTPAYVEQPFEVSIGAHVVRGRMDAIFHEGEEEDSGWMVVDWKTGKPPAGAELRSASIQLAVYRLAWAELLSMRLGRQVDPSEIRAAFYYVGAGFSYEPGRLPVASELAQLLQPMS